MTLLQEIERIETQFDLGTPNASKVLTIITKDIDNIIFALLTNKETAADRVMLWQLLVILKKLSENDLF